MIVADSKIGIGDLEVLLNHHEDLGETISILKGVLVGVRLMNGTSVDMEEVTLPIIIVFKSEQIGLNVVLTNSTIIEDLTEGVAEVVE